MKKEDFFKLKAGAIIYNPHSSRIAVLDNDTKEFRADTAASDLYGNIVESIKTINFLQWGIVDKNTPSNFMIEILWWRMDKLEHFIYSKFK